MFAGEGLFWFGVFGETTFCIVILHVIVNTTRHCEYNTCISKTRQQKFNTVRLGMLTNHLVPSFEHGCPIWVIVCFAYYFRKSSFSLWGLSLIATLYSLLALIALGLTYAMAALIHHHVPTFDKYTPDITETVVAILAVISMILTTLLSHFAVGTWAATCLISIQYICGRARRTNTTRPVHHS